MPTLRFSLAVTACLALVAACKGGDTEDTDLVDTDVLDTDIDSETDTDTEPQGECQEPTDPCVVTPDMVDTESLTLEENGYYLFQGKVIVGNDANSPVLTIGKGATLYFDTTQLSYLIISRGAKIVVNGTADAPVVMTSAKAPGSRAPGDWGGLVINGKAPNNGCDGQPDGNCTQVGEAESGNYGGDQPADSSGSIKYLRVEFGGRKFSDTVELNGVALQGVGSGTTIDNLHIHFGADDAIEFFGGTVKVTHLIATGAQDDNIDWTGGWTGGVEYAVIQQYAAGEEDNGIEADNLDKKNDNLPRSNPTIKNVTFVGNPNNAKSGNGMLLRRGTAGDISNAVVVGFLKACATIDGDATYAQVTSGDLTVTNSVFECAVKFGNATSEAPFTTTWTGNTFQTLTGTSSANLSNEAWSETAPNWKPKAGSEASKGGAGTSYRGAVDPNATTLWYDWTEFAAN